MDFQDMHSASDNGHNAATGHPVISIVLYGLSWLFIYLETLTADDVWTWIWRILSMISLLLIIYINWNRAKEIFLKEQNVGSEPEDE